MRKHWEYFKYVVRHKWFVFVAGLKVGAPLWRLIIHDWSKFLPSEWIPYANYFYGKHFSIPKPPPSDFFVPWPINDSKEYWKEKFDAAWNYHQKRNKHHWQYWVLALDDGTTRVLDMPDKYIAEMVADWAGAGKAIHGAWEVKQWYNKNKFKMALHQRVKEQVEVLLGIHF